MKNFQHVNAPDIETAVALLQEPGAKAMAGGTDLLTELKERIKTPETLVNLKTIPELNSIREENGELRFGALATLSEIEAHRSVREHFPILAQAISVTASPQLRNTGTIGGNLCQSVRCWYYRHPDVNCWLKGGDMCYAQDGVNRRHAIFGNSPCIAVHPSDLAPALIALDARVRIVGPEVEGELSLEEFFTLPTEAHRQRTLLGASDLVAEIIIPDRPKPSDGIFLKAMERAIWSFALVSVAAQISWNGDRVGEARLVLGGVAGKPWRVHEAEKLLHGQAINEELASNVGEVAVANSQPLKHNAYKIPLTKKLVKRALLALAGQRG
jgi:xanthine dehydrogenase YagS FAD-binding subunit